jgi:S1-C subfamily serine protease
MRPMCRLLVFACLAIALPARASDWSTIVPTVTDKVPRLEMRKGDDRGTCSGAVVLIDDGWAYALTAAHCVDHAPTDRFDLTANDRHGVAVAFNTLLDLAIVKFRAHDEKVVALADKAPPLGSEVAVVGYAFGVTDLVVQFGHVAQTRNKETKTIWLDVVTIFGDSGGLVMDDQGRLIAITSHFYSGGLTGQAAHISAAVTLDAVRDFLDDFRERLKKDKK